VYPGEHHVGQGADREQGKDGTQDERGVPHAGVVLDVARPLVGGDQAQAPRAAGPGDDRLQAASGGPQIGAGRYRRRKKL
jgi:hypothetical protein